MTESSSFLSVVTKEFLESVFKKEISDFTVNSGSNAGDNFTSLLYTIDIHFRVTSGSPRRPIKHVLLKTFPVNLARIFLLEHTNLFVKELRFYDTFIPEMIRFQEKRIPIDDDGGSRKIIPPFPELLYGKAIDFSTTGSTNKCPFNLRGHFLVKFIWKFCTL
jgi:hypothetical protein